MLLSFGHIGIALHTTLTSPLDMTKINCSTKNKMEIGGTAPIQLIAAARCGAKTRISGFIGNDPFGERVITTLRREGIQHNTLVTNKDDTPIFQSITTPSNALHIQPFGSIARSFHDLVPDISLNERTMIIINHDVCPSDLGEIIERAKNKNAKIALCLETLQEIPKELLKDIDLIISGEALKSLEKPHIVFRIEDMGQATGRDQHAKAHIVTAPIENIVDTSGCFDVFCGFALACLQAGLTLPRSIEHGLHAAQLCALTNGTYQAIPYLDDVKNRMKD